MIVDEVDDTRTTLKYCVEELVKTNKPKEVAVAVVHNKLKEKKAELSSDILYLAGEDVADRWNCYPWDAAAYDHSIDMHESIARQCAGEDNTDNKYDGNNDDDNDDDDSISTNRGSTKKSKKKNKLPGVPIYIVMVIVILGFLMIFNLYSRNVKLQKVVSKRQHDGIIRQTAGKQKSSAGRAAGNNHRSHRPMHKTSK